MISTMGLAIGCTVAFLPSIGTSGQRKDTGTDIRFFERYSRSTRTWYVTILLAVEGALLSDKFLGPLLDGHSFSRRRPHRGSRKRKV